MVNQSDPLAGRREELNDGSLTSMMWPVAQYPDCPVKQGESFRLRSCRITFTSTREIKRKGYRYWLGLFDRHGPERTYLLGRNGGYVEDPKAAMTAQADMNAGSPREIWRENPMNLGPPPEPEAVPPHVVDQLPATKASRMSHMKQKDDEKQIEQARKEKERTLRDRIRHAFNDLSPDKYDEVADRIAAAIKETAKG